MDTLSDIRQKLLQHLKEAPGATMADLADRLQVTTEAVRQHLVVLEREGWVRRTRKRTPGPGRPVACFFLTQAGEHLFPKRYDDLASELIAALDQNLGREQLRHILAALTEARVRAWQPRLEGLSLEERVEALKGVYLEDDPYMSVEEGKGPPRLVEHNCPFLNVAQKHPALCSVTLSTLSRLLGAPVVREKKFQDGDGRCVFRLLLDDPLSPDEFQFAFEDELTPPRASEDR